MGGWKAVSSGKVDEQSLRAVLGAHGTSWENASHVTATTSLARSVRLSGEVGLPIATLADLIVLPGVPGVELSLGGFPGPDVLGREGLEAYKGKVSDWQQQATGRRLRLGIQFDDALRRFSREKLPAHASEGQLLVRSRREFSRSVHALITAGIRPEELSVNDDLGRTAVAAWSWLEEEIPSLAAPRRDLWIDLDEFQAQSTPHARDLRNRVEQALERAFGTRRGRRVVVHHGFYFFTPPQWALFQLLRRMPDVDQLFVVHDDGANPVFKTWRRFFVGEWEMPVPMNFGPLPRGEEGATEPTPAAAALRQALSGEAVTADRLAESITVLECRNPAELVHHWQDETTDPDSHRSHRFAADAESVERFVRRLGRDADSGTTDLAQLPIGAFLLALHDCIRPHTGDDGNVVLSEEALLDITSSGYLETSGPAEPPLEKPLIEYVSVLRRAMPFFKGCKTGQQWGERADHLRRLIKDEVEPLGKKDPRATDENRIRLAADNPLRLVPWGDLSKDEAAGIAQVIASTVVLVEEIASHERVVLKDYTKNLSEKLARGMRELPEAERREINAKVEGFSVGLDDEIDVEGLVDVVTMLLGRTADFDALGDRESSTDAISELRGLDALSLHKQDQDLHVTNLAEGVFPSSAQTVGWPFRIDEIDNTAATVEDITVEILKARTETAALSDLYLLWLALDGVEHRRHITLSWISSMDGEHLSPSSFLSLLTRPEVKSQAVQARAGGLQVEHVESRADRPALTERPAPALSIVPATKVARAMDRIDPRAAASAEACARRLALQWILGQSHAFQSEHHQSMLHGNVAGALVELNLSSWDDALRTADDLWPHLTTGQQRSSSSRRVVHPNEGMGAHRLWTLTLKGGRRGSEPLDRAYQAAVEGKRPSPESVIPAGSGYLPPGVDAHEVCKHCPVRPSCAVWAEPRD